MIDYNKDIYGDYEKDIKNYIEKYKPEQYEKIIEKDTRTNIVNIFSEMRTNIIKWYPFEPNKKILEIGANYGEITQELVKITPGVTSIEFTKEKIECIKKRIKENVKLILCDNLKELKLPEKYDYIIIIGTGEYAKKLGFKNLKEMLEWSYMQLSEEGKMLVAIDNKFGVKYLAGSTRNNKEVPFANYKNYVEKDYKLYGKTELENMLKQFPKYKFYYPVPNYNLTNMIYTDEYLPKRSRYNIYYREDEEILFNETDFMEYAIKNSKFDFFTNSYLIEISKTDTSNVWYVNFSNMRQKQYKIITKITSEKVTKEAYGEQGKKHIENIQKNIEKLQQLGYTTCEKFQDGKILSQYINKPTMDEYLAKLLEQDKKEEFIQELDKWYKQLKQGFIDLVFQNVFYDGNEYIVFDQEWYKEDASIEQIMFRSIKSLFFQHNYLKNKITIEELYKKYNITQEKIEQFEKEEIKLQEDIVDSKILKFYSEKWKAMTSIEDIKMKYKKQLEQAYLQIQEISNEKDKISEENERLVEEIKKLKNSRFYKWTRFLRKKKVEK